MRDKQIIINGIDVSICERHCSDNHNRPNRCYSDITESYRDCRPKENQCNFYITSIEKQLARKTQECESLKKIIDEAKNSNLDLKSFLVGEAVQSEYEQQLDKLKVENDSLFKAIEEVNKINKRLKSENEELKKCYKNNSALLDFEETNTTKLVNKVMKIEQTLAEIKEIAKEKSNVNDWLALDILQKISECEV